MKKFIKSTTTFLLFTSVIYILLVCIWGSFAPKFLKKNLNSFDVGFSKTRFKQVKETKNIDILFLGSSHSYLDFDTRYYSRIGLTSFNLGSSAQTPLQTEILINRYIDNLNPKTIVFEVHPGVFSSDGIESYFDLLDSDKLDVDMFKACLKTNHILVYNSLIYSSFKSIFGIDKNEKIDSIYSGYKYIQGGFVQRDLSYFRNVTYKKKYSHEMNPEQFQAFERLVQKFKVRNVRLILIQAPITNALYNSSTINNEFDSKMKSFGEYYNFNETVQLNDSLDFFDDAHLNSNGVQKFNQIVIEKLFKK
jgi:poly-D-alanine transfer protein DltD